MIKYNNKYVGILGYGKSGKAAMKFLSNSKAFISIYDDITPKPKRLKNVQWIHYKYWDWKKLYCVVISPGIKIDGKIKHNCAEIAHKKKVPIINEVQLLMEQKLSAKVIGVTGTNGKSTLVSLISHILNCNNINNIIAGNYGNPACLIKDPGPNSIILLELSSFQLLSIPNLSLDYATIINITKDHIEYHGTFKAYKKAKLKIINSLKKDGKLLINKDDFFLKQSIERTKCDFNIEYVPIIKNKLIKNNNLIGLHNKIICSLAIKFSELLGLKTNEIFSSIQTFNGLPHRMEIIFNSKNLLIVNDSKATNGDSTAAALSSFKNIYWIAGGLAKKDGIGKAAQSLENVSNVFLFGNSKQLFKKQILKKSNKISITECEKLENIIEIIFEKNYFKCKQKLTVLFSPAAASFDHFKSFEHRGNHFKKLINKHIGI